MSHSRYRPEVDGLRAIAVLGVVLFHMGLAFPGGYVGVDVFFVISGFLITGIIMRDIDRGTFSMLDFWVRRIRRILPAVVCVVLVTLLAGYIILSPQEYISLGKSSVAQSLMVSNIYFCRHVGYFAESADYQPLMHTWSLAVEEQFYIFFPFLLLLLKKFREQWLFSILITIFIGSFVLSCYGLNNYIRETFFLLPTRAWELLAGGLLAIGVKHNHLKSAWNELLAWSGLVMIMASMALYDAATIFPGWSAMLPVAGSVLFIAANHQTQTSAGKLLSIKPMVFVGLISYSLYLWHWPLMVYTKSVVIDITLPWKIGLVFGSFILGILSWKYVETPFRKKTALNTRVSAFTFATLVLSSLSLFIWKKEGIPQRVNVDFALLVEDVDWTGFEYVDDNNNDVWLGQALGENDSQKIDFVLWGDSHAMSVTDTVDRLA